MHCLQQQAHTTCILRQVRPIGVNRLRAQNCVLLANWTSYVSLSLGFKVMSQCMAAHALWLWCMAAPRSMACIRPYRDSQGQYRFDTKGKVRLWEYSYDYLLVVVGMCLAAYRKRYQNQQCEATKNYRAYLSIFEVVVAWFWPCRPPPTDSWCTHRNDVYTFAHVGMRNHGIAWL